MSTSLLYHAFCVRGYHHQRTDYAEGRVIMTITQSRERLRCPRCGSAEVHKRGEKLRAFRAPPIGSKPVSVVLAVPRVSCDRCGVTWQVSIPFAESRKSYTRAFARYVLELSGKMTIQDVAEHLGVGWDLVKEIQKEHLKKHFTKPKLRNVRRIGIDEICIGKGHRYLTVVLDLDSGAVIHLGRGKGGEALEPFWKRLKASRAKIEAVAQRKMGRK